MSASSFDHRMPAAPLAGNPTNGTEAPDIETSSAGYAQRFSGRAGQYMLEVQTRAVYAALRGCAPGRVLDVGGGHGQLVDPLRELGWKVTVSGSSAECERNLRELHGKRECEFVQANILDLPFPDRSFELVTAVRLISHVDDWERLISELCRVSSRWVLIDYPSTAGLNALTPLLFGIKKGMEGNTRTYRNFSRRELERAFGPAGFRTGAVRKQFVLPMAVHRALASAAPLRWAESASRAARLTSLVGSPVILRVDRRPRLKRSLRILLVAPQPFFQERGTPIAVKQLAETLCAAGYQVDLLTYHEGADIEIPGLRIVRAGRPPGVSGVPIGPSWKKLVCDLYLSVRLARLLATNHYDVVHAVEEAIFPAAFFNLFARKQLVFDMDSLMSDQLVEKWPALRPVAALLRGFERLAIRRADWVLPVCEDLAEKVRPYVPASRVVVLPDAPLPEPACTVPVDNLKSYVAANDLIALYVGNLEGYQGVDLMLDAWAHVPASAPVSLVVIGGSPQQIARQTKRAEALGITARVRFIGPRPLAALRLYLEQADILLSPRVKGCNTPLKLYSYMKAAKPVLATRIRSHTQVLDDSCALLCEPDAAAMARGLTLLLEDPALRDRLGNAAAARVEAGFTLQAFQSKLLGAYTRVARTHASTRSQPQEQM
jgi:glycosyltransferase involved in cell wall biosynthesis